MLKKSISKAFVLIYLLYSLFPVTYCISGEIDATDIASDVIDGDTFDVIVGYSGYDRVRLADIDAPESGDPGYLEAKNLLFSLVYGKGVLLDIDDVYITDTGGTRLVCVVYVLFNSTHYLNVNKALLVEEVAVIDDHDNEFNPYTWTLYVLKEEIPEFPFPISLFLFLITTLSIVMYKIRK